MNKLSGVSLESWESQPRAQGRGAEFDSGISKTRSRFNRFGRRNTGLNKWPRVSSTWRPQRTRMPRSAWPAATFQYQGAIIHIQSGAGYWGIRIQEVKKNAFRALAGLAKVGLQFFGSTFCFTYFRELPYFFYRNSFTYKMEIKMFLIFYPLF